MTQTFAQTFACHLNAGGDRVVTIRDVAQKAGVSTTTVSHVINQSRFVSPAASRRVRRAMKVLNYQPNAVARSLRRKDTHTLGLVLPDSSNPFFAEVARGIEDFAFAQNYTVLFGSSDGDLKKESAYLRVFVEKQVDGIIFVAAGESAGHLRQLLEAKLPLVVVDREFKNVVADYVVADNRSGGFQATEHLIQLGHRVIACIAGPSTVTPSAERVTGYRDALKAHAIAFASDLVQRGDFSATSGFNAAQLFLASPDKRPTAIFACNDLMALGALGAIYKAGLRVPDDVSLVGYDDIALASYSSPPLTTIQQPKSEMGRLAAQILLERIKSEKGAKPQRHLLPTTLIVRQSTCKESSHA
jgi:LacI family transcriptional regulator